MKEIKITHEECLAWGELVQIETFPFFGVGGIEIIKVFATPKVVKEGGDLEFIAKAALKQAPKRFEAWQRSYSVDVNQFQFHYGFEIRDDDKLIKVITILFKSEDR